MRSYLRMFLDHAMLADIDPVLEAELVGYFPLGTFTQSHYRSLDNFLHRIKIRKLIHPALPLSSSFPICNLTENDTE